MGSFGGWGMKTAVSVIIVNYNGGPLLAECVRSVLASNVPVEVLVSDNASTDTSLIDLRLICGADERLRIIESSTNLGFARANNLALEHSKHPFLLFLNPDCIVRPDTLYRMLPLFEVDPKVGMAGCLIRNPDGSEQPGCRRSIPTPLRTFVHLTGLDRRLGSTDARFRSYLHTGLPLPTQSEEIEAISGAFMLVQRAALDEVGCMDAGFFMHFEDLDWCLRFRLKGWKVMFEPSVEILHVGGVCTAMRPMAVEYHKHMGMIRFYRKFFRDQYPLLLYFVLFPAILGRFMVRVGFHSLTKLGLYPGRESRREAHGLASQLSKKFLNPSEGVARRAVVTGATSLIGDYLVPALFNAGYEVHAISRKPLEYGKNVGLLWHEADITHEVPDILRSADVLIHLAPLATLPPVMDALAEECPRRVIAFGSTSVFTKTESALEKERELAQGLMNSETQIAELSSRYEIHWTIFRPTLVYHLGRDKNVTTIADFLNKFGFFPLVNGSRGLRQPVHAEDLALASLGAVDNPRSFGKAYNLCGGETLTYQAMVRRIAQAIGIRAVMIDIPLPALKAIIQGVSLIPRFRHLNTEMATRISRDMCFGNEEAAKDLGFTPRRFLADLDA
jgi:GT2 family glycosyltransferase/nucleoside-diphosphate-sugar epimerase